MMDHTNKTNVATTIKVLIVEDNPIILGFMKSMFKMINQKIDFATTVEEALHLISKYTYQLIVTDIGLPDATGMELVEEVRAMEQRRSLNPAYICGATAFKVEQYRTTCFAVGFDDLVPKPMNIYYLRHLVLKAQTRYSKITKLVPVSQVLK